MFLELLVNTSAEKTSAILSHVEENIVTNSCIFNKPIQINIVPTFGGFHSTNFDGVSITSRNYRPRDSLKKNAPRTTACPSYSIDHEVIFEHILNCDSIVAKAVTFETTSKISAQTQTTWVF